MALPDMLAQGRSEGTARLFPVVAETNKENRITSVFLALLPKIPDLASSLLRSSGVRVSKRTKIECYTEVVLKNDPEKNGRPDGLIIVDNGKARWTALIEVKIGKSELDVGQVERYLKLAKANSIDAVITISNQFVARADHPPVAVQKNLLRSVDLFHWPWMWVLTQCKLLQLEQTIEDCEQNFLLDEFVRFLDHPSTGVNGFTQMNKGWKELVSSARTGGVFSTKSQEVEDTVAGWIEEQRDICLLLSRTVGKTVRQKIETKLVNDPILRLKTEIDRFCKSKDLTAVFRVPDAASDIVLEADLVRRTIDVSMKLKAPLDRKSTSARVNWLLRMLKDDDNDRIFVRAYWPSRVAHTQVNLVDLRSNPTLIQAENPKLAPHSFEILLIESLGGRFSGSRTFVEDIERIVPEFYSLVGHHLSTWQPKAPKPVEEPENLDIEVDD